MLEILSLIAGVLAVAFFLICFQLKKRKNIIVCNIISRLLYIAQYCLIGQFTGAVMDVAAVPSSAIAGKKDNAFVLKFKIPIIILVNVIIVAVGFLTMFLAENGNLIGLLSIAGVLFETIALWFNSEKKIRILSLFGAPCWFVYNIICGAYASAVGNVLVVISIVVALCRYRSAGNAKNIDK